MITVGSVLAGYRIEAVAGEGGMGRVYRATQLGLNRQAATSSAACTMPSASERMRSRCSGPRKLSA